MMSRSAFSCYRPGGYTVASVLRLSADLCWKINALQSRPAEWFRV